MSTESDIQGQYRGTRSELFNLAFVTSLLTLVTLGIYRFWAKTRIRKYIWSSVSGDGDAFEYTGTGMEKFLGFLVAIVVLAIYLGVIQMVLFFFGISFVAEPTSQAEVIMMIAAIYINLFALFPLIFYAAYRARRYKMARTRWRGVRFGMEQGAWGFALRACGYTLLTIVSLGLLAPLANFKLEKYMADRSWYGDAKFEQGGKWTKLYAAMLHVFIGIALLIVGIVIAQASVFLGMVLVIVGYGWLIVGSIYYRVHAMRYMAANRTLGDEVTFTATPRTGELIKILFLGSLIIIGITFGIAIVGSLVFGGLFAVGSEALMIVAGVLGAILYIAFLVMISALSLVFIVQPMLSHFVTELTVHNKDGLNTISQRAAETGVDAEGFADALDVGGAF
ncbi:DUF898 domain-containing protein [Lentibacter algarum]|uniref:YjgN family protein n=1 Tax=Lentibacter algarum TaxID=576131 RepID=UPI001C08FFE4|nr:DUF898 family protein [Lentibacter algarum]MBU2983619.1 DUF898 domain-containing protein [Lentibacter algarum]